MEQSAKPVDFICGAKEDIVVLPKGVKFRGARFQCRNNDLTITSENLLRVYVRNFFANNDYPTLRSYDGEEVSGHLAAAYVTLSERALTAMGSVMNP